MEEIIGHIRDLAQQAIDGEIDALKAFTLIREVEKAAKEAQDEILSIALDQFRKYGKKTVELYGYKISESAGGKYDYKDIHLWVQKKKELDAIQEKAQLAFKSGNIVDGIEPAVYSSNKASLKFENIK